MQSRLSDCVLHPLKPLYTRVSLPRLPSGIAFSFSAEVAHVGAFAADLDSRNVGYDVYEKKLSSNDRAILEGRTEGLVRILCKKGTDKILGASIVSEHAGESISEITLAMESGTGLSKLASIIHPYPTEADAIRACGDLYNKTRLTLMVRKLLRGVISLHRPAKC